MMFGKLSRRQQIEFISLWASLKQKNVGDKDILQGMHDDYMRIYGSCQETDFCEHAAVTLQNWGGGRGGFHTAMEGWFDNDIVVLVSAVAAAGNVQDAVNKLFTQLTRWQRYKTQILIAIASNTLLILFGIAVFIGLTFVTGYIVDIAANNGMSPPPGTEFFMSANELIRGYWLIAALSLLGIGGVWLWCMYNYVGEGRTWADDVIPFYGFYRAGEAGRFFLMLSLLVSSGSRPLRRALEYLEDSGLCSLYIKTHIQIMLNRLQGEQRKAGVILDKIDTGLLPSKLRLKLLIMQRQKTADQNFDILQIIGDSLMEEQGEMLLFKVKSIGKICSYSTLTVVVLCGIQFLDIAYSLTSLPAQ